MTLHSFTAATFLWHLLFDGLGDAGGYWAAKFCEHWYHRVPIAIGFGILTTLALVAVVG